MGWPLPAWALGRGAARGLRTGRCGRRSDRAEAGRAACEQLHDRQLSHPLGWAADRRPGVARSPLRAPARSARSSGPTNPSQLFVTNAHGGAGNGTVSAFSVSEWGVLSSIGSSPFADLQTAPCWVEISHDGRYLFAVNTGSGEISSYAITPGGSLTLLGATPVGAAGAGAVDARLSPDGRDAAPRRQQGQRDRGLRRQRRQPDGAWRARRRRCPRAPPPQASSSTDGRRAGRRSVQLWRGGGPGRRRSADRANGLPSESLQIAHRSPG